MKTPVACSAALTISLVLSACGGGGGGDHPAAGSSGNTGQAGANSGQPAGSTSQPGAGSSPPPTACASATVGPRPPGSSASATPAATVSMLYSFSGGAGGGKDGALPNGGLVLGCDGNFYGSTLVGGSSATLANSAGVGTVFKITPGGVETVLHSFTDDGVDGTHPQANLILGRDGNLYGSTRFGGPSASTGLGEGGTIFRIAPSGQETILYAFGTTLTDGAMAASALVQGSDGNLYGTTIQGGANGKGTIFRIDAAGTFTSLYSFNAGGGTNPVGALLQASDGNFYGATLNGGDNGTGTVFKYNPAGATPYTDLYSFEPLGFGDTGGPSLLHWRGSLVQGNDGNLYGADSCRPPPSGFINSAFETIGACGPGAIYSVATSGNGATLVAFQSLSYSTNGPIPPAIPLGALLQGTDGSLYGVTARGGAADNTCSCGTIFKVTPTGTLTILYSFNGGTGDGANPQGPLIWGVDGNLYGTTLHGGPANAGTVFKVVLSGN